MLLIFDGPDKVGKTTLINAVDKATNYQHIMIDRGPTSYIVYDKLLNKDATGQRKFEYLRDLKDLEKVQHLCIYLEANEEDVDKRLSEVNEKPINGIPHVEFDTEFNKELWQYHHRCKNTIVINTSDESIEDSVNYILTTVNKLLFNRPYLLLKLTEKKETCFGRDSLNYVEYYPSYNSYSLEMLYNLPFSISIDRPYYEMLFASLDHMLHKQKLGLINKRQMVYTSNDCISFVQLIPINDTEYDLLVCQRSLDLKKHGYNDLAFFVDWIYKNKLKVNTIHYNVSVPHMYF